MLFNSAQFGVFLIFVCFVYWSIRENRPLRHSFLLACSLFFYMCWNEKYVLLLIFSTVLDFHLGKALYISQQAGRRKLLLGISVLCNLGLLGIFKYFNFFAGNVNALAVFFGLERVLPALDVLLPVGISFYTFQTMSYTIEIYQRKLEPCSSIVEFALFVSFFPQLVAGPIVRASQFLPQLTQTPPLDDTRIGSGLYMILKGLFKKVIVADYIALHLVDRVYADPGAYESPMILLAMYGFFLQLYCDFAGYSDIAIGGARLLGFDLPINFRSPFKATSIRDFWTRWHITMTSWFRDFVFFPLGGSRKGEWRTAFNIMCNMLVVGLWHGASWIFILWGIFMGCYLWAERLLERLRGPSAHKKKSWYHDPIAILITFHLILLTNTFFRTENLSNAGMIFSRLFSISGEWNISVPTSVLAVMVLGYATHFLPESWKLKGELLFTASPAPVQAFASMVLIAGCIVLHLEEHPFFYFQF